MKQVVHYQSVDFCEVGASALVTPLDHPSDLVSNTQLARTSTVQSYDKDTGIFETKNTIYKPAEQLNG